MVAGYSWFSPTMGDITLFFVFSGDFIDKYTLLQLPQNFLMKLQTDILIRQQMLTEIKQKSHYLQSVRLLSSRNLLKIYIWKVFLKNQPNLTFSFCLNNSCKIGEKMLPVFLGNIPESYLIVPWLDWSRISLRNTFQLIKKNPLLFNQFECHTKMR